MSKTKKTTNTRFERSHTKGDTSFEDLQEAITAYLPDLRSGLSLEGYNNFWRINPDTAYVVAHLHTGGRHVACEMVLQAGARRRNPWVVVYDGFNDDATKPLAIGTLTARELVEYDMKSWDGRGITAVRRSASRQRPAS